MTSPIPPSLERFGDELDRAAHRELSTPSAPLRAFTRRPRRFLAGGTLGLAGVSAALVLALSGTAATAPAFAVTRQDGSVLVTITQMESVPQANAKLVSMGIGEYVDIEFASGTATTSGAVACTPGPGVSGPPVKVLLDTNGTEVIASGNTGAGTWHVGSCSTFKPGTPDARNGNSGIRATLVPVAPLSSVAAPPAGNSVAGNTGAGPRIAEPKASPAG